MVLDASRCPVHALVDRRWAIEKIGRRRYRRVRQTLPYKYVFEALMVMTLIVATETCRLGISKWRLFLWIALMLAYNLPTGARLGPLVVLAGVLAVFAFSLFHGGYCGRGLFWPSLRFLRSSLGRGGTDMRRLQKTSLELLEACRFIPWEAS